MVYFSENRAWLILSFPFVIPNSSMFLINIRFVAGSGIKRNLDLKSDQIPLPIAIGAKGGKSLSRISGGILGSKSVLNLAICWTADTHNVFLSDHKLGFEVIEKNQNP
jgi:hypothetical protein